MPLFPAASWTFTIYTVHMVCMESYLDIDDPIMGTTADFEDTYILIEECVIGLINHLQQHPLA